MSAVGLPPLVSPTRSHSPPSLERARHSSAHEIDDEPRHASAQTPRRAAKPRDACARASAGRPSASTGSSNISSPSVMGLTPSAMQRIAGSAPADTPPRAEGRRRPSGIMASGPSVDGKRRSNSRASSRDPTRESSEDRRSAPEDRRRGRRVSMIERATAATRRSDRTHRPYCDDEQLHRVADENASHPAPIWLKPRVPADVSNAYIMGSLLGSGAFGTVWMAQNRDTLDRVAIKIVERKRQLHEDFSLEPAEAEILKDIDHPSIVKLIDYIPSEYCVYLVMELVLGGHLQARLKETGPYDEERARRLIVQVLGAVHHLHDRNIIHRDIKPENILFVEGDPDELSIKLTDFGLSIQKEGRLTTRCGTPSYCAPELLSGEGYGKMVDMWSVGVLTYVVLTGSLPFIGSDRSDLFRRIQKGAYSFDAAKEPSEYARDMIARLLKLEPMERYSTREALHHPWLNKDEEPALCRLNTVHEMMRQFNAERRLRRAMLVVVACGRFQRALRGWPQASALSSPVCGWSDEERSSPGFVRPDFALKGFTRDEPGKPNDSIDVSLEPRQVAQVELSCAVDLARDVPSEAIG